MALVVEDGTGKSTAESYISVTDADAYATAHVSSGATAWALLATASKESALRYATTFIDRRYAWPGWIVDEDQALSWPRTGAVDSEGRSIDSDVVPSDVKAATCEAAFAHIDETLAEIRSRGGETISETVGPISVTYSSSAPSGRSFPYIDSLLSRLAGPKASGIVTLVRA